MEELTTALMSGVIDGFNPVHLAVIGMVAALIIVLRGSERVVQRFVWKFLPFYLAGAFFLRVGFFNGLVAQPGFYRAAASFYCVLGILFVLFSLWLAWCWAVNYFRGVVPFRLPAFNIPGKYSGWPFAFVLSLSGLGVAFTAFIWPACVPLAVLSNKMFLPGLLWPTIWLLLLYEVSAGMGIVVVLAAGYFLSTPRGQQVFVRYRSLALAVLAGFYAAVGAGILAVFVQWVI